MAEEKALEKWIFHPENDDQASVLIDNNGLVVVKFGAEWCPPCKKIAPILE